jgi:hypothetical protein
VNVLESPEGLSELRRLGARSVPVVSRGDRWVFAQVIKNVVTFLGLSDDTGPQLSPDQLGERYDRILETAIRLVRQVHDANLNRQLPNRPRSWRVLMHHIFQIPTAFLDSEDLGEPFSYENMVAPPPNNLRTSEDIARFGEAVCARFVRWRERSKGGDFSRQVRTYFGEATRHEMLERTAWHSAQHIRQLTSLIEAAGITPDRPLTGEDLRGLPLPDKIWDGA